MISTIFPIPALVEEAFWLPFAASFQKIISDSTKVADTSAKTPGLFCDDSWRWLVN